MEILLKGKVLLSNNFFHANLLSFFKNSNCHKISSFNARDLKFGHFDIFDMLFSISGILKVTAHNFVKSR